MNIAKRTMLTPVLVALVTALGACETPSSRQQGGAVVGGILGGVIGSQVGHGSGRTAATIVGVLAGAAVGGAVGRSMDDTDRMRAAQGLESARTGAPVRWVNPDTRREYVMVPTRTYETTSGPCRDYTIDANIEGRMETVHGTACRQADGTWRVVG